MQTADLQTGGVNIVVNRSLSLNFKSSKNLV